MLEKIWILLKADRHSLNIINKSFTDKAKSKFKNFSETGIIIIIALLLCVVIGFYANFMAEELSKQGLTYVMLAIMIIVALVLSLTNTVYKSQGMLFTSKDNDLLLSLPISKKVILSTRLIKLMLSQYIWTTLILVPSLVVYAYYEGLTLDLIISSLVLLIAIPVIPVIIGTILGYIITVISSRFKHKNLMQIIISILIFVLAFTFSYKLGDFFQNLVDSAEDIYVSLRKIYYPLGLFIECLEKIDLFKLLQILLINFIPLVIFVFIFSIGYFKIISKLSENHSKSRYTIKRVKVRSGFATLFVREAKRYFRSSIYLLNTIIGPMIMVAASIYLIYKSPDLNSLIGMEGITAEHIQVLKEMLPVFIYGVFLFCIGTSNISASSISLEGSSLWVIKSMPVSITKIFLAKIAFHSVVILVPTIVAAILCCISLELSVLNSILLLITLALSVITFAVMGLLINILLPKFNSNAITVVKQSASSFCSIMAGIILCAIVIYFVFNMPFTEPRMLLIAICGICVALIIGMWTFIQKIGANKFKSF